MRSKITPTFHKRKVGLPPVNYSVSPGWFAYNHPDNGSFMWVSCRDTFQHIQSSNLRATGMYMVIHDGRESDVAAFLHQIEYKLNVHTYTKFRRTSQENVLWFQLSPFWLRDLMRRSLLTILLRCGLQYRIKENNFDEALYSTAYANETSIAIQRFMRGFTYYHKNATTQPSGAYLSAALGWYSTFRKASITEVRKLLQKKLQTPKVRLKT